jgi:hypothetical protein
MKDGAALKCGIFWEEKGGSAPPVPCLIKHRETHYLDHVSGQELNQLILIMIRNKNLPLCEVNMFPILLTHGSEEILDLYISSPLHS